MAAPVTARARVERPPENVLVAVVEVAVKKGTSTLPVESMVSLAVFEGPTMVEFAMLLVMPEPKAEAPTAEEILEIPNAEDKKLDVVFCSPNAAEATPEAVLPLPKAEE